MGGHQSKRNEGTAIHAIILFNYMTLVNKILNFKVVDGRLVRYGKQLEAEEDAQEVLTQFFKYFYF